MNQIQTKFKVKIREIPDFPQKGVNFKDITPILANPELFASAINQLSQPYLDQNIDTICGIDARGFIFASAMAYKLKTGLTIVRKPGKLPFKTHQQSYSLEYGTNTLEIHQDAIIPGQRVVLVDDLLATGGTMAATIKMIEKLGGHIAGISFLINLSFLKGANKLQPHPIHYLIKY